MRDEIRLRARWIKAWPGKVSLIEPTIGSTPGFPDAHATYQEEAGLVEFKALDSDGGFELEPSQRLWLLENLPHYTRVMIVGLEEEGFRVIPLHFVKKGMPLRFDGYWHGFKMIPWSDPSLATQALLSARLGWTCGWP